MTRRWLRLVIPSILASCVALGGLSCGSDDTGDAAEARALLDRAFAKPLESANVELDLKMDLTGPRGLEDPISLRLSGPYRLNGDTSLPTLDWDVSFASGNLKLAGGLVLTRDNAFVEFQGTAYVLGRRSFQRLAAQLDAARPGGTQDFDALGVDPTLWLRDAKVEDGEDVAGEQTREVSGPVDVRKVVEDVVRIARSPEIRRELGSGGALLRRPTQKEVAQIESSVEKFDVEVNVGEDDTVRRFFTDLEFELRGERDAGDVTGGKIALGYVLSELDGDPSIRAPASARPLRRLLERFGLGGVDEALGSR